MNFRRQPFQFTSIDPVKRQAELQKRFGLPSDEMYVDFANPGVMGAGEKESLINGSPRLQHRVPIFSERVHNAKSTGIQNNVDNGHQPRVRVIPIQVEGVNDPPRRHRTFSGPTDTFFKSTDTSEQIQPKLVNAANKNAAQPRVCNIPIKIESNQKGKEFKCNETIIPTVIEQKEEPPKDSIRTQDPLVSQSLKNIELVLKKLKGYQVEVEKFAGTNKDKKYRYLDEMLTRCMLDLDNVDTLGIDNVRLSRKDAVKQVQACIDLLETKVNTQSAVVETTQSALVETTQSVPLSATETANSDASIEQSDVQKDIESDTDMKECDAEHVSTDVEMEKESSVENTIPSSQFIQACDIEMADKSLEDQSTNIVVEECEDADETLTEVKNSTIENTSSENSHNERITIEDLGDNSEGIASELVIEEMCSDDKNLPDSERSDAPEVSVEPVVIEHDSCELPELSTDDVSNEQMSTISSDKSDPSNSSLDIVNENEKISISEILDETDVIL